MNITTGVWTKLTIDVPYPLGETSACLLNKNIVVYGSLSPGRIAMFTPARNKWQQLIEVTEQGLIGGPGLLLLV
uniref:Uncharacterized protein n=1 Tax=Ciona savignyi TaxID=51511 RepID=H2YT05_CIOSA